MISHLLKYSKTMANTNVIFKSERVYLDNAVQPACIVVSNGKIVDIVTGQHDLFANNDQVIDVGSNLIMPGVVDCHVHVNEPGRTMWEGYVTATRAAAAGGVTTIVDMPLNSIPTTVTIPALQTKLESATEKCYVDVGFWGGIVPGNQSELVPMLNAGVMGFKCFLIHSGVDDFPMVTRSDLVTAFAILQGTDAVVLFHAEVDCHDKKQTSDEPTEYKTFLSTRPEIMELEAIKLVCELCIKYRVRCHIVHLSAADALPMIMEAREKGAPLTVETCHHYLSLDAETIPNGATQYKCCPPIRGKRNQERLWQALKDGSIDMVVSDHSPCTPDLKHLETGNFLSAWGGIASVQFGPSLFWTNAGKYGMGLDDMVRLLCRGTASLAGLSHRKGTIKTGYDADFVIWNPDESYEVIVQDIQHRNKVTPYIGTFLKGVVKMTVVGGHVVFENGRFISEPRGKLLFKETTQKLSTSSL